MLLLLACTAAAAAAVSTAAAGSGQQQQPQVLVSGAALSGQVTNGTSATYLFNQSVAAWVEVSFRLVMLPARGDVRMELILGAPGNMPDYFALSNGGESEIIVRSVDHEFQSRWVARLLLRRVRL